MNLPGQILALASVAPALAAIGWLVATFGPAALGVFHPALVLPLGLAAAVAAVWAGQGTVRRTGVAAPWWAVLATVAIAVGFAAFAIATHNENVVLRRDPGSYAQISFWLSQHHALTYPIPAGDFGTAAADVNFASPAFYVRGDHLVPQFMTGWPTLLAAVGWLGGWSGVLVLPGVIGGLAVLAVGGLAGRLVGPRFAPLAAGLTALAWPVLRVAQTTYSEPLAMLLLAAGVAVLVDLVRLVSRGRAGTVVGDRGGTAGPPVPVPVGHRDAVRLGLAAGLLLGGGELVRLDFGVDLALALPVLGWLWLAYRPAGRAMLAGCLVGAGLGLLDCVLVTLPYVSSNWASVRLMVLVLVLVAAGTGLAVHRARHTGWHLRDRPWWPRVPALAASGVLLLGLALVLRPYLLVDHSTSDAGVRVFTAIVQGDLGLPVDGSRGYAEQSLWWVSWYLGWPLLAAALYGVASLVWQVLRGRSPGWVPALLVYVGSAVLTLLRPGVTPDHPWADRRLVVEVIPAMVLFATWTVAALAGAGAHWAARVPAGPGTAGAGRWRIRAARTVPALGVALAVLAMAVPAVLADLPVAALRTELGQLAASARVCQALRPGDSVVMLDMVWAPTIRAQCRVPVAQLRRPSPASAARVADSIRAAGRTPVIAGSRKEPLTLLGLYPTLVVGLHTTQDQQQLVRRPTGTKPLDVEFWLVRG